MKLTSSAAMLLPAPPIKHLENALLLSGFQHNTGSNQEFISQQKKCSTGITCIYQK